MNGGEEVIVKLSDISDINLGTILTRVKPKNKYIQNVQIPTISMQELSYECGKTDDEFEEIISTIEADKVDKCLFVEKKDVVIGLSSQNAMVISNERAGKLLLSNFCHIRINKPEILEPNYLVWLFNENTIFKNRLTNSMQGTAYVKMITLDTIRSITLDIPSIEIQRIIGRVYSCSIERDRLAKKEIELKKKLLNKKLENYKER